MTRGRGIGQLPDGRARRRFAILGRMISFGLIVSGAVAVAIGAHLRPILGRWIDKRNIERLGRRHDLDPVTAEELYRLARRVGFGSAWQTLIEGRADATVQTGETTPARRPRAAARTRSSSLAERNRA